MTDKSLLLYDYVLESLCQDSQQEESKGDTEVPVKSEIVSDT